MRTTYGIVLVLAMATGALLVSALPCRAAQTEQKDIWSEGEPKWGSGKFELTEKVVERAMNRLAKTEPVKAKELEKLREKDPAKLKAELRKVMRERFGRKLREGGKQRAGRKSREGQAFVRHGMAGEHAKGQERGMVRERMREKHTEYLEWLGKNYPEEAKKLAGLREKRPKLHMRQTGLSKRKYGRIFEAAKENPKLAEALKEDLKLKRRRDKLLGKIRAATDDAEKKQIVKELEEVINSRFDLIVKRKQIRYELLSKRLEKLKKQLKKSEAEIEKWKKVKGDKVKERVEELISRTEKFKWD